MTTLDAVQFRAALSRFASGVTVVTARAGDGSDHGMTVSAFSALSLEPPLVLVCLDETATLLPHLLAAATFGVSILGAAQGELSRRFADQAIDRFDGVSFIRAASGPALLDGAVAHLECRRTAVHHGGDHAIVVGEVLSARTFAEEPLVYFHRWYGRFERQPGDPHTETGEFEG
ncbi:MAG: flavin reductase family protein [Gemmatimonadota bacterium]|mgnify:CR=1 FL=1